MTTMRREHIFLSFLLKKTRGKRLKKAEKDQERENLNEGIKWNGTHSWTYTRKNRSHTDEETNRARIKMNDRAVIILSCRKI